MNRRGVAALAAAAMVLALAPLAQAKHEKVAVVRLHVQTEVAAPPAAVWAHMTTGKNLVTWCPEWKSAENAEVDLTEVGDVLDYTDAWGNGGRSVVTYLEKDKELRVAHEPTKGDYMCQAKLVLTPAGKATTVHYWEQYTDESEPKDLEATAAKMESEMAATLAALKRDVEQKK